MSKLSVHITGCTRVNDDGTRDQLCIACKDEIDKGDFPYCSKACEEKHVIEWIEYCEKNQG